MQRRTRSRHQGAWALLLCLSFLTTSCTTVVAPTTGTITVVAAERQWGSIVQAIGGSAVSVTNVISSPTIDPHAYEPSPNDANAIAVANYVVLNGLGYDAWMTRLIAASGHDLLVANVGERLHLKLGANPHRWYAPSDVATMTKVIAHDLSTLRPSLASQFHQRAEAFRTVSMAAFDEQRNWIRAHASGISIGASESIFSLLMDDLHLRVATPARFLRSVSEGGEPTAQDLSAIARSIRTHEIALYCENIQNVTPAVAAQVALAKAQHPPIPVVTMTETPPQNESFATWQTKQLTALANALHEEMP